MLADDATAGMRYRLLETMREYGGEQLFSKERGGLERRHAEYYLALAEGAAADQQAERREWFAPLEADYENLRAGLAWALENEPVLALRLACALRRFWLLRGHWREGSQILERVLEQALEEAPAKLRVTALSSAGSLASRLGDQERAKGYFTEHLELSRKIGDRTEIAGALHSLAVMTRIQGDGPTAVAFDQASLEMFRALNDENGIGMALAGLGYSAAEVGEYAEARSFFVEALTIARRRGSSWGIAEMCLRLAGLSLKACDYAATRVFLEESLANYRELGHKSGVAEVYRHLGLLALTRQDAPAAQRFFEESLAISQEAGDGHGAAITLGYLTGPASAQGGLDDGALGQ
jgi:tetratricopeptide (TPR) repeat protein